jgi:rubrerythrin
LIEKQFRVPAVNPGIDMQLTRTMSLPKRRGAHQRVETLAPQRERNKRANVSQDAALYSCSCGYVFKAAVTTSVGCPHCGTDQAW